MKKGTLLFLAVSYFICASGIYVHAHFCAGELSSVSYFALNDGHDCGCGDEPVDSNCCKDIQHFYKVDSHQQVGFVKALAVNATFLVTFYHSLKWFHLPSLIIQTLDFNSHAPPPFLFTKASKCIVNSVFRL